MQPELEQAWKTLALVTDWLRHAEAKLGIILGFTGVSAGVLFNLVKEQANGSCVLNSAAAICCVAVVVAGTFAMLGLLPVIHLGRKHREEETVINPLYFHDIAHNYVKASSYIGVLGPLTTAPDDLVRHIGQQVHANASVASRKYRFASWAMWALLVDLLALGSVAAIAALGW
ncbi:Pycsar system effector family protein [Corynebacterium sp. A21]|uniref:Pycsar system effector family protein n=1 Tax=Corynebacterium sp. A21 TaxID=3457318 RepID=UPI003FD4CC98